MRRVSIAARRKRTARRTGSGRLATGIPGLDRILSGGLVPGGLYLVAGRPGSGKTVLSNQICFQLARRGLRSLYLTLLTESHGRMVENVSSFAFFDRSAVGSSIVYLSAYRALRERGLDALGALIDGEMQRLRPTVMVLDGVAALTEAATATDDFRLFLNKVRAELELRAATGLLCMPSPVSGREATQMMADGVLVLAERIVARRALRELTVSKLRGSLHLGGPHLFEIDRRGITVHPRSEAILGREPADESGPRRRARFGIPQLDEMLEGGLPGSSTTAIVGAPGSGKTLLGLRFLAAGAVRRENGLYVGFYETPERLVAAAEAIGIPLRRERARGRVGVRWLPPYENLLDPLLSAVLEEVQRRRVRRLFLDGLEGLTMSIAFRDRVQAGLTALANELRAQDTTTVLSIESPVISSDLAPLGPESAFVENLILLRYVQLGSQVKRLVSIVKVRGSGFDSSIREFHIGSRGIEVQRSSDTAEAILAGAASAPEIGRGRYAAERRGTRK